MEDIRQNSTILSEFHFINGGSNSVSRFLPVKDDYWQCRFEGPRITFWKPEQSVPCGGWRFRDGANIVDACSMSFADGSDGVVIAVNDVGGNKPVYFLAYYSFAKSSVVKMITIKNKITCVYVLIGNLAKSQILELNSGLQNAPHWIAVGTEGGSCYLTHFNIDSPSDVDLHISAPTFSTNVSKNYISDNVFLIDTPQGNFSVKLDAISVTALSYVPKCWLLLIGLSCGAVISVGLSSVATRMMYYMYDGPVRSFAWQEPNDDPRPTFYLWMAHDGNEKRKNKNVRVSGAQVILAIIIFPDDEGKPFSEWTYHSPRIQRHFAWSPGSVSRWVSFRTIVQNESMDRIGRIVDRSTTFDESTIGSTSPDSTLLLMVWVTQRGTAVQGALFDLNAFYYKRLIKSVIFDETIAHQCPFLSLFTLLDGKGETSNIQDVIACPESFMRFTGPLSESNDALFYPSALSFSVVILKNNSRIVAEIRSIQLQVLNAVENNVVDAVGADVNLAAQWMIAVGLADSNSTFAANTEWYEPSLIISGLLNHGHGFGLKRWLEENADEASREDFTKFLWDFVQDTKEHFDENSSSLFARISTAPPKWTISWLQSAYFVFSIAEELFGVVQNKMTAKTNEMDAEIECHRRASSSLALYTRFVLFMLRQGVLPESTNYGTVWTKLKENVDKRYLQAQSVGKRLFIHELLEEMKRLGKEEEFWANEDPTSLYPPKTLLILFDPVLALQIATVAKLKLMGYFFLDYDRVTNQQVFARFKNIFLAYDTYLADHVVAKYEADSSLKLLSSPAILYADLCCLDKPQSTDFRDLMKQPLLDEAQYDCIKENLLKLDDGITEWNDFCIARQQLQRLIEPTNNLKKEEWKNVCDQWARRFIKEVPRFSSSKLPLSVIEKWKTARNSPLNNDFVCITRRRLKRRTTLHETLIDFKSAMELRKRKARVSEITPERMQTPETDNIPMLIDEEISPVCDSDAMQLERILPKENLERVRRILQTPPSVRRMGYSIKGGIPMNLDLTPENNLTMQPTSILKSAAKRRLHKDSEPGTQLRLRFDLPNSDLDSTSASISDSAASSEPFSNETYMVDEIASIPISSSDETKSCEEKLEENVSLATFDSLAGVVKDSEECVGVDNTRASEVTLDATRFLVKKRKIFKETRYEVTVERSPSSGYAEKTRDSIENSQLFSLGGNEALSTDIAEQASKLVEENSLPTVEDVLSGLEKPVTSDSKNIIVEKKQMEGEGASTDSKKIVSEVEQRPSKEEENSIVTKESTIQNETFTVIEAQKVDTHLENRHSAISQANESIQPSLLALPLETPRRRTRKISTSSSPGRLQSLAAKSDTSRRNSKKSETVEVSVKRGRSRAASTSLVAGVNYKEFEENSNSQPPQTPRNSSVGRRPGLRSASKALAASEMEIPTAVLDIPRIVEPEKKTPRRGRPPGSPSRRKRAGSVLSTASAPERTPKRAPSSPSPSRKPSKRTQRAASEVPIGVSSQRARRRIISSSETNSDSQPRSSRFRAGRKTVDQVLQSIEEEAGASPSRSSSRTRKAPKRYPQ